MSDKFEWLQNDEIDFTNTEMAEQSTEVEDSVICSIPFISIQQFLELVWEILENPV